GTEGFGAIHGEDTGSLELDRKREPRGGPPAQERDDALRAGREAKRSVGVGCQQVPERFDRPYDREEGPTQSLGQRGLGPSLERRLRGSARAEHDVPAPEDGLHVREPRRLERFLQIEHLRVYRHDTTDKRGIAWHKLEASARQGTSSSPRHMARASRACTLPVSLYPLPPRSVAHARR